MDIEKTLNLAAPPERVWALLLDPQVMGACVPGMQSIEVVSPTEYHALMAVKIAFVSAKFRLKTTIVEQDAPRYLRAEGTGEDASVASSLKQRSEMFLTVLPDGSTELRIQVRVDVLGKLGTFGLSVMKTKADRMWDEFGENLARRIAPPAVPEATAGEATHAGANGATAAPPGLPEAAPAAASPAIVVEVPPASSLPAPREPRPGWWPRLLAGMTGRRAPPDARHIRIELKRDGATITVHWPLEAAGECATLLRDCLR